MPVVPTGNPSLPVATRVALLMLVLVQVQVVASTQ